LYLVIQIQCNTLTANKVPSGSSLETVINHSMMNFRIKISIMKNLTKILFGRLFLFLIVLSSCKNLETAKKPDIILIMADDMGFSDMGVMGSEINTPVLNTLAEKGILYTQFYNGARCCPTRASLLTGLYPHQAGMGWMTVLDLGIESYSGELNLNCMTIAEVLKECGYNTYMSGKWHLCSDKNTSQDGNKNTWPLQRGFDRFFGTLLGSGSYYTPGSLTSQNTLIEAPEGFYYTDAISDSAINMIRENRLNDSPFFLYVSYTSPHWPLHAYKDDYEPYIGVYSAGWDSIRVQRFNHQKELGIIDEDWILSERNPEAPAWDTLPDEKKEEMALRMAIYAAQIERMDRGIGRIIEELEKEEKLDNTLIFFLQDNGACAEFITGRNQDLAVLGTDESFESYRLPWANASNTPFRLFKHWTHEGGISTPLIVHWPEGSVNPGRRSNRPGQLMDIMATCIEVTGAEYPLQYKGIEIHNPEGESLLSSIRNESDKRESLMFWEHEANRAVRSGDWKLVLKASVEYPFDGKWELYNLADDRTEMNDLADTFHEKVEEMKTLWEDWAQRIEVYPLDNRSWEKRLADPKAITKKYFEGKNSAKAGSKEE
jgi:arylsulfatase A-like enzyme